ncbi:hypothetical protein FVEN_g4862 [Fusarium venenatum]|uniref:Mediator of RNA polymerase II transcription subunit 22 n=1 Tax=Fusarium venenatum TaxID=56646 RepID=A0A2L2ST58_9HYPO|nr:uncharacterized protein FVRRES_11266 [Fusarium venenatum]KAG8357478.1 hypothetical protein FVEN_g4862 [Fusarium venenatum]CEI38575.1 unnamed protein product [Fusarium venenatum]
MDSTSSTNLLDKHNKLIFEILRSYRDLMNCATIQGMDRDNQKDFESQTTKLNYRDPETMAAAEIRTQRKFDQLHDNIKQLLALSRTIKELWVFGPLDRADGHRQEKEVQIDRDVQEVSRLLANFDTNAMQQLAEKYGGSYEPQAAASASSATATTTQPTEPAPSTGN